MSRANPRYRRKNPRTPAIPNGSSVLRIEAFGSIESQMTINTWTYLVANNGYLPSDYVNILAAWKTAFWAHYLSVLSADWSGTQLKIADITVPSNQPQYDLTVGGVAGTGAAGHEPTTVAVVCGRQTGTSGQHGRGRLYLPAVPTSSVSLSKLITPNAALTTFVNDLKTTIVLAGFTYYPCVYAKTSTVPGSQQLSPGAAVVTSTYFSVLLGTIRRRRIGRGK